MNKKIFFILLILGISLINTAGLAAQVTGDVNMDNTINVVDALMTAQYYVGMNPAPFDELAADVNGDGDIDIVDALIIALYTVGLIDVFPVTTAVPPIDEKYKVIRVPVITLDMFEI